MIKMNGNRIFLITSFLFIIAFATRLPVMPSEAKGYPSVVMLGASILNVLLFIRGGKEEGEEKGAGYSLKIVFFVLLVFAYLFLMGKVGYILATLIFLYALFFLLRLKQKKTFIILPIVLTTALYLFFSRVLSVFLPEGSWINIYF